MSSVKLAASAQPPAHGSSVGASSPSTPLHAAGSATKGTTSQARRLMTGTRPGRWRTSASTGESARGPSPSCAGATAGHVPAVLVQEGDHAIAERVGRRAAQRLLRGCAGGRSEELRGEVTQFDHVGCRKGHGAGHRLPQLADVQRPVVSEERARGLGGEREPSAARSPAMRERGTSARTTPRSGIRSRSAGEAGACTPAGARGGRSRKPPASDSESSTR